MDMRGLAHFIRDIREASGNRKAEEDRVNEELSKIRSVFISSEHISSYDRKKYICKLMFISILGYPITFGHMEALKLISGETPSEKLVGYLSMTILLNESSELLPLTTHTVYRDLMSPLDLNRNLALTAVAHTGGRDFAEVMHEAVQALVANDSIDVHIRKKALMTLLRLYRKYPEMIDLELIVPKAIELIGSPYAGVSMCAVTFLNGCVNKENMHLFHDVPKRLIDVLSNIIIEKQTEPGYVYYGVPAPWLQAKILHLLQYFPYPKDPSLLDHINLILKKIVKATDKVLKDAQTQQKQRGTQNRVSAMNSILFELVSLVIQWKVNSKIILECVNVISSFLFDKRESNLRYLGLTLLARLSFVDIDDFDFQVHCKQHQPQIIVALHDADVSIRRKALDVLVAMCNPSNANEIIKELLTYLPIANEPEFKMSLILCIALLAEKYGDDSNAYVDIILSVVAQGGDVCPAELSYRVAQVVVNEPAVQKRASSSVFNFLKGTKNVHQLMMRLSAFILGEFGFQIALNPDSTPLAQFNVLFAQLEYADAQTQSAIIAALFKFYNTYDSSQVREKIVNVFRECHNSPFPELQQRTHEYLSLIDNGNVELLEKLLQPLPAFDDSVNPALDRVKSVLHAQDLWVGKLIDGAQPASLADAKNHPKKKGATTSTNHASEKNDEETIRLGDLLSSSALRPSKTADKKEGGNAELDALFRASVPREAQLIKQQYTQHRECFSKLLFEKQGVLFANEHLRATCTQSCRTADVRMAVVIEDVKGGGIKGVSLEVLSVNAGLLLQVRGPSGQDIPPKGSATFEFAARSLLPYPDVPSLRFQYSVQAAGGGAVKTEVEILSLPLPTVKFVAPYHADSEREQMNIVENLKRNDEPLDKRIVRKSGNFGSKEAVLGAMRELGFHCLVHGDLIVAVAAHAAQLKEKIAYTPLVCQIVYGPVDLNVSVYSMNDCLKRVLIEALETRFA